MDARDWIGGKDGIDELAACISAATPDSGLRVIAASIASQLPFLFTNTYSERDDVPNRKLYGDFPTFVAYNEE